MPTDSSLTALDDGALARRVAAGGAARADAAAEAELLRRLAPRVRLYGLRHLRDPHAAADLVQQVMLVTLERLRAGELREPDRVASFVLGTSRMMVMEMRRGVRRREEILENWIPAFAGMTGEGAGLTDAAIAEPQEPIVLAPDRLAGCLEALAERERSVVVLSFFSDLPAESVGKELGIAAGNVRVIRHRALRKLRECME